MFLERNLALTVSTFLKESLPMPLVLFLVSFSQGHSFHNVHWDNFAMRCGEIYR